MQIGILKCTEEPLVAIVPKVAAKLKKIGHEIAVEKDAGKAAFFDDAAFEAEGVEVADRASVIAKSEILVTVSGADQDILKDARPGTILIGKFNILNAPEMIETFRDSALRVFSLDKVPRSSIAQSMDVLSSLASLAGYKAVIKAAEEFSGYFPMMTTAAGTIPPAKVLVLGAGVAGLQAIATAKRLGAVVEAFDVRSAVKEEVESLGAKFVKVTGADEDSQAGGYAVEQTAEYIKKQKELIHDRASKADIVISTANIPGKKAPLLIEKSTVAAMQQGSVIIDMATASGGNCEVAEDGKMIYYNQVKIIGDSKLYNQLTKEASILYANNVFNFMTFILKDGDVSFEHEIALETYFGRPIDSVA
ncbi:MAG: NAD(P) transhydrogenase subunit alpha [Cyclobacteriaceae bacterium]